MTTITDSKAYLTRSVQRQWSVGKREVRGQLVVVEVSGMPKEEQRGDDSKGLLHVTSRSRIAVMTQSGPGTRNAFQSFQQRLEIRQFRVRLLFEVLFSANRNFKRVKATSEGYGEKENT